MAFRPSVHPALGTSRDRNFGCGAIDNRARHRHPSHVRHVVLPRELNWYSSLLRGSAAACAVAPSGIVGALRRNAICGQTGLVGSKPTGCVPLTLIRPGILTVCVRIGIVRCWPAIHHCAEAGFKAVADRRRQLIGLTALHAVGRGRARCLGEDDVTLIIITQAEVKRTLRLYAEHIYPCFAETDSATVVEIKRVLAVGEAHRVPVASPVVGRSSGTCALLANGIGSEVHAGRTLLPGESAGSFTTIVAVISRPGIPGVSA